MSQMGKVIKAVRKLFSDRSEMHAALNKDEPLYRAAQKFNEDIDAFETRHNERIKSEH